MNSNLYFIAKFVGASPSESKHILGEVVELVIEADCPDIEHQGIQVVRLAKHHLRFMNASRQTVPKVDVVPTHCNDILRFDVEWLFLFGWLGCLTGILIAGLQNILGGLLLHHCFGRLFAHLTVSKKYYNIKPGLAIYKR